MALLLYLVYFIINDFCSIVAASPLTAGLKALLNFQLECDAPWCVDGQINCISDRPEPDLWLIAVRRLTDSLIYHSPWALFSTRF